MTDLDPVAVLLGAIGCGLAGSLVPALIARIPEPATGSDVEAKPAYAVVAAAPRLLAHAVAISAGAGALTGAVIGLDWALLVWLPLIPVGAALGIVDLHTRLLPTVIVWPTGAVVAVLATAAALLSDDLDALVRAGIGAAVVFALFYVLWWIHPAGMGFGDVRLSAVLGLALAYLGWAELAVGIYGAFLAFALPGLVVALLRRDRSVLRAAYPFGPFLLLGALGGLVLGPLWTGLGTG